MTGLRLHRLEYLVPSVRSLLSADHHVDWHEPEDGTQPTVKEESGSSVTAHVHSPHGLIYPAFGGIMTSQVGANTSRPSRMRLVKPGLGSRGLRVI